MALPPNARYLFQQVGLESLDVSLCEILSRKGQQLRNTIRGWWSALEPEATAGISVPMMEARLVTLAEKAVEAKHQHVSRRWARSASHWMPGVLQGEAEQIMGERLLATSERLGVLVVGHSANVSFTHPALLELFLGIGLTTTGTLPSVVTEQPRIALKPLDTPRGRSVLARLAIADAQERDSLLVHVARQNVHLATWFVYYNEQARQERGEWLARELLSEVCWGQREADVSTLQRSLASLGPMALAACRHLLDERRDSLPAFLSALLYIADHGSREDRPRLQRLLDEPILGQWEIENLREVLREAQPLVVDEETQKRYARAEKIELAKDTGVLLLKVVGTVAERATEALTWNRDTLIGLAGSTASGVADELAKSEGPLFYRQQRALREVLAQLPAVIERRKREIAEFAPRVQEAARVALRAHG